MLKMRLTRIGRSKRPFYRVVVTESTSPRDGRFLEIVGNYDPLVESDGLTVKTERVQHWLSHGVQPTRRVHSLLAQVGIMEPLQAKPIGKKTQAKREAAAAAKAQAAAEAAAADAPAAEAAAPAEAEATTEEA